MLLCLNAKNVLEEDDLSPDIVRMLEAPRGITTTLFDQVVSFAVMQYWEEFRHYEGPSGVISKDWKQKVLWEVLRQQVMMHSRPGSEHHLRACTNDPSVIYGQLSTVA